MHFVFLDHFHYCFYLYFLVRVENFSLKCFYFKTVYFVIPLVLQRLKTASTKKFS